MSDKTEAIKDVIECQKADGNWNYGPYMHGMLNGMLLIESIATDKKFEPFEAPKKWLYTRWYKRWYNRAINKITGRNELISEQVN